MKTLVLDNVDRSTLAGQVHDLQLLAKRLERHVQQNITDEDMSRYLSEARALLDVIEARTRGAV